MTGAIRPTDDTGSLFKWTLSFLRPYRGRVAVLIVLLLSQIVLGALQPWPLKIVIDYALDQRPLPEPFGGWLAAITGGSMVGLLVLFVPVGVGAAIKRRLVAGGAAIGIDVVGAGARGVL